MSKPTVWSRAKALAERTPETRNRYVDFLRAASITVVVLGHVGRGRVAHDLGARGIEG